MSGGQVSPRFSVLISCSGSTNGKRDAQKPSVYSMPTLSLEEQHANFKPRGEESTLQHFSRETCA